MPFGPNITVAAQSAKPGHVSEVILTKFGPAEAEDAALFPFSSTDPALQFLGGGVPIVKGDTSAFYEKVVDDVYRLVWGIKAAGQLMGFVSLDAWQSAKSPNYMIALVGQARGRRIGSLATAGVAHGAFASGLLHEANGLFDPSIDTLETVIHPDNRVSRAMCERAGFVRGRSYIEPYEGRLYPWIEYSLTRGGVRPVTEVESVSIATPDRPKYRVASGAL